MSDDIISGMSAQGALSRQASESERLQQSSSSNNHLPPPPTITLRNCSFVIHKLNISLILFQEWATMILKVSSMNIISQKSIFITTNSFTSPRILFSLLCTQINYISGMSLSKKNERNLSKTVDKFVHFLGLPIVTDVSWFVRMVINANLRLMA